MNFDTKRFFYIKDFENTNHKRGFHANLNFNEFIVIIKGKIELKLTYPDLKGEITILDENSTYYIKKNIWVEYTILDINTIILCLTDKSMNESISEKDFNNFIELNKNGK
jgi:hypothetical protein